MEKIYISIDNINKTYGKVNALQNVSLCVHLGEILAVVGDNGAGKSTLIKVLSGAIKPDSGIICVNGKQFKGLNPKLAIQEGISTVYQNLALAESQTIAANIFLGQELMSGPFLDHRRMREQAIAIIGQLGIDIPDVLTPVAVLSGGQRQGVAVARALRQGGKLFVFDEPTAAMGVQETKKVQKLMKHLKESGFAVVLVSHNLQQVFEISDRILVMRHGRNEAILTTSKATIEQTVLSITGAA